MLLWKGRTAARPNSRVPPLPPTPECERSAICSTFAHIREKSFKHAASLVRALLAPALKMAVQMQRTSRTAVLKIREQK